jgi:hypothetical protein
MEYKDHYKNILAENYSWAFGGLESNVKKNFDFFSEQLGRPKLSAQAIDLGAGSGFQSIPLARLGYVDSWELYKSSYRKVKIPIKTLIDFMKGSGFTINLNNTVQGMIYLIGKKGH